jgi:hypothetical protein
MNTAILGALVANPSVLVGKFFAEALPGAAIAYGVVWRVMRPKDGRKVPSPVLSHAGGVFASVTGGAIFRIIAIATFAGRSAFEPAADTGAAAFYIFLVPAVVAAGYIAWLKSQLSNQSKPRTRSNSGNDAYVGALAEIGESRLDKGVWARAFAEAGGDEPKAKALYIKARAESLKAAGVGSGWVHPATKSIGLYEAAIGEKSQAYYIAVFDRLDQGAYGLNPSWNWAAFLFAGYWALYRKLYGWFFACIAVVAMAGLLYRSHGSEAAALILFSVAWVAFAVFANAIYHLNVKAKISAAQKSISEPAKLVEYLSANGGVHAWVLPIVGSIPLIGIVLALALPAYNDYTKRRVTGNSPVQAPASQVDWSQFKPVQPEKTVPDADPSLVTPVSPEKPLPELDLSEFSAENQKRLKDQETIRRADTDFNNAYSALEHRAYGDAFNGFSSLARQGDARAQVNLGSMYYNGVGVAKSYAESAKWYRLSAAQGNSTAQSNLGAMYALGQGVRQNILLAHMWLNLSAAAGNLDAANVRDTATEKLMTPQQIALAQQMARDCQQRSFKGCD